MAINKKLIHFKAKETFNEEFAKGNILDTSICFIKETKEIWTHGQIYDCSMSEEAVESLIRKSLFVGTQSEYDAVSDDIADGAIVIIIDQLPSAEAGGTSAILGTGVLGQLILGKS